MFYRKRQRVFLFLGLLHELILGRPRKKEAGVWDQSGDVGRRNRVSDLVCRCSLIDGLGDGVRLVGSGEANYF